MTTVDLPMSLRTWVPDNRTSPSACCLLPCPKSRCICAIEKELYVDGFTEQGAREGCGPCSWEVKVLLL